MRLRAAECQGSQGQAACGHPRAHGRLIRLCAQRRNVRAPSSAAWAPCPYRVPHSTCRPFVGPGGRVYAVAAGRPGDPSFDEDHAEVCDAMEASGQAAVFNSK